MKTPLFRPFEWLKAELGPFCSPLLQAQTFQRWRYAQADDSDIIARDPDYDALMQAWRNGPAAGISDLIALAERGSVWGMVLAGSAYYSGQGVNKDNSLAEHWFRPAFKAGSRQAQLRLGRLYEDRSDLARCREVYTVGAADRWPPAMFYLARIKFLYPINPAEREEARILLEAASEQGDIGAQTFLGTWMARGWFGLCRVPRGFQLILDASHKFDALFEAMQTSALSRS